MKLDDGTVWKNVVTEAKSKVAQTVADFRGCHQYNLGDEHMRRFIADTPQIVMWDDHEVLDNWYWERRKDTDDRYQEKSVAILAARARQAFVEYNPLPIFGDDLDRIYRSIPMGPLVEVFALDMRSYKSANSENRQPVMDASSAIFGAGQLQWLKASLEASKATWKIVAADLPLGLIVGDGPGRYEAVANGEPGAPLGRELELADLLRDLKRNHVKNVVWITADVHYCAAHHYDPVAREVHRVRPVLGVRRRSAQRRHVRTEHARFDLRTRSQVRRHPAWHEGESSAVGRLPVLRDAEGQREDARPYGSAP